MRFGYKPRIYLLGDTDCLRGFTSIGKIITPTVKTHIGATTMSIDSNDISLIKIILEIAVKKFLVMRIYI